MSALAIAVAILPAIAIEPHTSFDRTLTVTGPVELDAATHAGAIAVRAGGAGSVRIHGVVRSRDSSPGDLAGIEKNPPIRQTGNTIYIDPIQDESLKRRVSISYEITVPADARVRMRSGSGTLSAEGVRGPVDASTGSGAVTVSSIGDQVRVHTGSGRIELSGIKGAVDAHTGSGSIGAAAVAGEVVARTGSGGVEIEQTGAGPVKAHTGSGNVKVRLPAQAGFDLRAHTGSGKVSVEHPITVRGAIGGREVNGKVRGGGPLVEASTGSGSVRIE